MAGGLVFAVVMIASFLVFGSLGMALGQKLEKRGVGESLAPGCAIVVGVGGTIVALWLLSALTKA